MCEMTWVSRDEDGRSVLRLFANTTCAEDSVGREKGSQKREVLQYRSIEDGVNLSSGEKVYVYSSSAPNAQHFFNGTCLTLM